jgi:very-short-patch-repair endonuclease
MSKSNLERAFMFYIKTNNLPVPVREFRFCPDRKWRFDFAYPERKIAIEVEGGIWIVGRHSRGKGMLADMEKYNWAVVNGWKILRYAQNNMTRMIEDLRELLK